LLSARPFQNLSRQLRHTYNLRCKLGLP
jgi:hypothetical protein